MSSPDFSTQIQTQIPRTTRGLRNRNPGNLRDTGIKWDGMTGADPAGFAVFCDDEHGIRALVKDLRKDYHLDRQRTVAALISEFAPANENHTKGYVSFVARYLGVDPDVEIPWDQTTVTQMVRAIITMENGVMPYSDAVLAAGIAMGMR